MAQLLLNPRNVPLGEENILLNARARRHYTPVFPGPLSVKSVIRGEGRWKTSEGEFLVDTSNLLILNEKQEYSLTIEAREPVETLCLFFRADFIPGAVRAGEAGDIALLDDPVSPWLHTFAERTHPQDGSLGRRLRRMHNAMTAEPEPLWLEAQLFAVAREMVQLVHAERSKVAAIPAVKASTREELFRRTSRAKAWLDARFDEEVSVEDAARSACLSPHHFHRVFTGVFGITPHRYVVERRLGRAAHLLQATRLPVVDVCAAVGFQSLGSFSTLFRGRFGITPARMRI